MNRSRKRFKETKQVKRIPLAVFMQTADKRLAALRPGVVADRCYFRMLSFFSNEDAEKYGQFELLFRETG